MRITGGRPCGDTVLVESDSAPVIGLAAIMYLLPMILLVLGYVAGQLLHLSELGSIGTAALAFALSVGILILGGPASQAQPVHDLPHHSDQKGLMFGYVRPRKDELKVPGLGGLSSGLLRSVPHPGAAVRASSPDVPQL